MVLVRVYKSGTIDYITKRLFALRRDHQHVEY